MTYLYEDQRRLRKELNRLRRMIVKMLTPMLDWMSAKLRAWNEAKR